ncbi:MAG TPA: hypothetical protein DCM87_18510 [Planctomycetes bacterium]|nr:hypothetical protein [Planctomycetota bacterium]
MKDGGMLHWCDTAAGALLACVSAAMAACPGSFLPGEAFNVGWNFGMCVAADIDGDGNLDLITGTRVLLGDGNGGFPRLLAPDVGVVSDALVEDFDRDGHADMALVSLGSKEIHVLFGREHELPGDEFFEPDVSIPTVQNSWHMACGDLDGNGTRDIVVGSGAAPALSIVLNNGDRTFRSLTHAGLPQATLALALGDYDGDGQLDIASGNSSNAVLLFGNGDGTFGGMVVSPLLFQGAPAGVHRFRADDFDRDGRADLVACTGYGVSVYSGAHVDRGAGLPAQAAVEIALAGRGRYVELADMSRDGLPDIVALAETEAGATEIRVLCGLAPTPDAPIAFTAGEVFSPAIENLLIVHALGDMNEDGAIDVVAVAEGDGESQILFGTDTGAKASGDANGDGTVDVADAIAVLSHLFADVEAPCPNVINVNGDARVDIADAIYMLSYLFAHGPAPCGAPRPCG